MSDGSLVGNMLTKALEQNPGALEELQSDPERWAKWGRLVPRHLWPNSESEMVPGGPRRVQPPVGGMTPGPMQRLRPLGLTDLLQMQMGR